MVENYKDFSRFITPDMPIAVKLVGKTVSGDNFRIERMHSDLLSLEYIVSGEGTLEIAGQTLHPKQNDVFLLTEGSNHTYYASRNAPWQKYFISFCGPLAEEMIRCYLPENTYLFPACNVENYFKEIYTTSFSDEMDYAEKVSRISVALLKVCMYIRSRCVVENEDLADKIRHKLDYYVEHSFSLDLLCQDFNYSKNYIICVFKKKFGQTPYQYYMHVKIETAKRYLLESSMSIGEIAETLAFTDQQYFSFCFNKTVGCSPRQFRTRAKKKYTLRDKL